MKPLLNVMPCAIWYHLYNLKNVKNTHGGVLISVKLTLLHGCFLCFLNCTNSTKSRNAPHVVCLGQYKYSGSFLRSKVLWYVQNSQ